MNFDIRTQRPVYAQYIRYLACKMKIGSRLETEANGESHLVRSSDPLEIVRFVNPTHRVYCLDIRGKISQST